MKHRFGFHHRRAGAAADHRRAGAEIAGFRAVGAAQAEFHDRAVPGFLDDAGGLGRDQRLVIHDREKGRFDELRLDQGCLDPHDRFVWEDDRPFRHRVNFAREFEMTHVIEKGVGEFRVVVMQLGDVFVGEGQPVDVVDHLFETGRDGVAAVERIAPDERVKHGGFAGLAVVQIHIAHAELIEISRQL